MMDVSILVPTYNGQAFVRRFLESLVAARKPDHLEWEVIVIDNNSSDDTSAVVKSFNARLPNLRYAFQGEAGKCRALNLGLGLAQGVFVAFLDHDVLVDPAYLEGLARIMRSSPYKVFGGRIIAQWPGPAPAWINDSKPLLQSRGGIIAHDLGEEGKVYRKGMKLPVGANFFCRRELFDRAGLFDVNLGPRPGAQIAGEESDLLRRFQALGEEIWYAPEVAVYHPVDPERATKAYFRYRFFCDGRAVCRMEYDKQTLPKIFGIPRYLFRQLGSHFFKWLLSLGSGSAYRIFDQRLEMRYTLGMMYEYRRIAKHGLRS